MKLRITAMDATGKVHSPCAGPDWRNLIPTDMGMADKLVVNVNAYRYSPHTGTKVRIATVTIEGAMSGIINLYN